MNDTLVYCDICGEAIYSDETRYELPDGRIGNPLSCRVNRSRMEGAATAFFQSS